jgi:hypothetical protein
MVGHDHISTGYAALDSIIRPACSKCRTKLRLFGIEPDRPGYELLSFECPSCKNIETRVGQKGI